MTEPLFGAKYRRNTDHSFFGRQERMAEAVALYERQPFNYERIIDDILQMPPLRVDEVQGWNTPADSIPSGGEPEKEGSMKIYVEVTIENVARIIPLLSAINETSGCHAEGITEEPPAQPQRDQPRRVAVNRMTMRSALIAAAGQAGRVKIDYTDASGASSRGREVVAISFDNDMLLARDPAKGNAIRTFYLSRMTRVETL